MIVYADFSCPECYLAARRADLLAATGVPVDFRAVEHEPGLPVTGRPLDERAQAALTERFAALSELLLPDEELPWAMPTRQPKTEAAVTALAEAIGAEVGDDVRRLVYGLYWIDGADIGNPNMLRIPLAGAIRRGRSTVSALHESGYGVAPDRGPVSTAGWRRLRDWREDYRVLGRPQLPVVLVDGATLTGFDAVRRIGKELVYADSPRTEPGENPRRYPAVRVHPGVQWVSQIGGPWMTVHRPLSG